MADKNSNDNYPAINVVTVIGRLTNDPTLKYVNDTTAKTRFRIAVDNGRDRTLFVDVEAWGKPAESIAEHLEKGRKVAATGRLEFEEWDRPDGTRASRHFINTASGTVQFLDRLRVLQIGIRPEPTDRLAGRDGSGLV